MKSSNNRLAVAGRNFDLKVFDLTTKQCFYNAKSQTRDWLGLKAELFISDLDWVGGNSTTNSPPNMIGTCSRTEPVIRIFDLKSKSKKPAFNISLKDSTFNCESNPPSFTSLCTTAPPHSLALPTQNIVAGTTMGRMIAIDLRFNSHSYRHLGVFKGFGGGAIRDIKYVGSGVNQCRVLSCSLDRFVRIHQFNTTASSSRQLETKYYLKTRPTCLQPICSTFLGCNLAPMSSIDDDISDDITDD